MQWTLYKKRWEKYRTIKTYCLSNQERTQCVFEFYYTQNFPLPKLNVTPEFYKQLLWFYVMNMHSHSDNDSIFYAYLETEGTKNAASVVSYVYHFVNEKLQDKKFEEKTEIILFSDAAGDQNKNDKVFNVVCRILK